MEKKELIKKLSETTSLVEFYKMKAEVIAILEGKPVKEKKGGDE